MFDWIPWIRWKRRAIVAEHRLNTLEIAIAEADDCLRCEEGVHLSYYIKIANGKPFLAKVVDDVCHRRGEFGKELK